MGGGEYPIVLHPEADQRVDIEEPSISQFPAGQSPINQPIVLTFEEVMQTVLTRVQLSDSCIDRAGQKTIFAK